VILFPVNGKVPAVPKGTHWKDYDGPPPPADQPAGWAIPEGVLVVDIDGEEGWTSAGEADPPLPGSTIWWHSLSGAGAHYVYRTEAPAKNRRVLPGVDVKTHGGYVVVPAKGREKLGWLDLAQPERLPPAPAWAYERAVPKPEQAEVKVASASTSAEGGWREWHPRTPIEERCRRVAEAPEGERNETLNREAYLYGLEWGAGDGDWSAGDLPMLVSAGVEAGLSDDEALRTARSGLTRGVSEHVDPLAGVRRGVPESEPFRQQRDTPEPGTPDPAPEVEGPAPTRRRYRTNEDILGLTSPRWLLPGRIMDGLNLVVGFPKSGKSILSVAWAWEAARLGKRVLYVPAEHEAQFRPLLEAYLQVHGDEGAERMHWWYEEQVLRSEEQHAELMAALAEEPVDLVVVDTLSAAAGGLDENEASSHVDLAENAAMLSKDGRARAVLLIHHTGYDKTRAGGSSAQIRRPVVYSVLERNEGIGAADPEGRGWSKLTNRASRFAGAEDYWYAFTRVPLRERAGEDGFGRVSHSHVCEAAEPPAQAYDGEPDNDDLAPAQARAMMVLRSLAPGQPLPSISALAAQVGCGKSQAAKALKLHEREQSAA
jgi:hypothetical protein